MSDKPKKHDRSKEPRAEGRWRLDFSRKSAGIGQWSEPIEQRRAATRAWLQHNYPHVLRDWNNGVEDAPHVLQSNDK